MHVDSMITFFKRYPLVLLIVGLISCIGLIRWNGSVRPLEQTDFEALYAKPAVTPTAPKSVFHLGHSLVGRDMPAMLAQLSGDGYRYDSQLGWGTPMKGHWDPDVPINGFEVENNHERYRDAKEALSSGAYDALILTEMVEIRDAIKYFDSDKYLYKWTSFARNSQQNLPIYLYETWHNLDDPEGWMERLDRDLERYWEKEILRRALRRLDSPQPIYVIPAGQVMARFVRELESRGGVGPIRNREDMFADNIHFNDYGAYLVALTHYATLYQKSPVGLPHTLFKADNSPAKDPGYEAARLMQEVVWDVVTSYNRTGVPQKVE